ncbi:MAG TPA: SDR family oxidoreductase [Solirubrobacteraceae bacterium]|jgi:NAD(P)-dependent dehydrogenase (short-subunit alcohol dehydrogenase family)
MPSATVLGARNLGGAIVDHLLAEGWQAAAVARSDDTLERVREAGALALRADAADPGELAGALRQARESLGGLDLVVNAVSAARPPATTTAFGGGPLAEATVEDFRGWAAAVAEQAFVFLSEGARALRAAGGGGTLVQVTGGSARRALPARGLWSAGAQGTRALVQAAAQELREEGIHVALLIVDATIESPKTEAFTRDVPREALADQADVARAVAYLASQSARGQTYELQLTPAGERWVP